MREGGQAECERAARQAAPLSNQSHDQSYLTLKLKEVLAPAGGGGNGAARRI